MTRVSTASFVLVATLIAAPAVSAVDTHAPHWGYDHPALWGDLSADFKECKVGKEESPIDISTKTTEKAKLPALGFNYKTGAAVVFNNGHTVQVNLIDGGSAKLASGHYSLLQFYFDTPPPGRGAGSAAARRGRARRISGPLSIQPLSCPKTRATTRTKVH